MNNVYQYLRMLMLLCQKDLDEFKKFLDSDYHNTNGAARVLLNHLLAYFPNSQIWEDYLKKIPDFLVEYPFLERHNLFTAVYGQVQNGNYGRIDVLMTKCKELLEDFFIVESLKKDKYARYIHLLRALKNSGFNDYYEKRERELKKENADLPIISITQLKYLFSAAEIDYAYLIMHLKSATITQDGFSSVLKDLNQYAVASYLKYSAETFNRAQMFNEEAQKSDPLPLLASILFLISKNQHFYDVPIIRLYYHLIKCLLNWQKIQDAKRQDKDFKALKRKGHVYYERLTTELKSLIVIAQPQEDAIKVDIINVYNATCNYLIRKMDFDLDAVDEILSLNFFAIDNELFKINDSAYIGIVKRFLIAIQHHHALNNVEKAQQMQADLTQFESKYIPSIPLSQQSELKPFIDGLKLVYALQVPVNYKKECEQLYIKLRALSPLKAVLLDLSRRVLLAQLSYKSENSQDLESTIGAAKFLLASNTQISANRKAINREFFNCVENLERIRASVLASDKRRRCQKLCQKLLNPKPSAALPVEREWLINELKRLCNCNDCD